MSSPTTVDIEAPLPTPPPLIPPIPTPPLGLLILRNVSICQPWSPILERLYGLRREDLPFIAEEGLNYDITISNGRISRIDVAASVAGDVPHSINRSFGSESPAFIFPGLIDSLTRPFTLTADEIGSGLLTLAHGVTTIRSVSGDGIAASETATAIATGQRIGPRSFYTGRELDGPSPARIGAQACASPKAAQKAAETRVSEGASYIAIGPYLTGESLVNVLQIAKEKGLKTVGYGNGVTESLHLSDTVEIRGTPWGGAPTEFENYLKALNDGTVTTTESTVVGHIATPALTPLFHLAHESNSADLNEGKIVLPSTIILSECQCNTMGSALPSPCPSLRLTSSNGIMPHCCSSRLARAWLPAHITKVAWGDISGTQCRVQPLLPYGRSISQDIRNIAPGAFHGALRVINTLNKNGAVIHAGSDSGSAHVLPGLGLHTELLLLSAAGLGDEGALASATILPACALATLPRFQKQSQTSLTSLSSSITTSKLAWLGFIVPGALADFVISRADPRSNLSQSLSTIIATVAAGQIFTAEDLDTRIRAHSTINSDSLASNALPLVAPLLRVAMNWWK